MLLNIRLSQGEDLRKRTLPAVFQRKYAKPAKTHMFQAAVPNHSCGRDKKASDARPRRADDNCLRAIQTEKIGKRKYNFAIFAPGKAQKCIYEKDS